MYQKLSIKTNIIIATIALITFYGINYYFIRPVPKQVKYGTIQDIEYYSKNKVERKQITSVRNNKTVNTSYTEQARFVYIIKLEDGKKVRYLEYSNSKKPDYNIGDKLLVTYSVRNLLFYYEKTLVYSVEN